MRTNKNYLKPLENKKFRLTKERVYLLELLELENLTFRQIKNKLEAKGHYNLSTLYNNLSFFVENDILTEVFINEEIYYSLNQENNNQPNVYLKVDNKVINLYLDDLDEFIDKHPDFKNLNITNATLTIIGEKN